MDHRRAAARAHREFQLGPEILTFNSPWRCRRRNSDQEDDQRHFPRNPNVIKIRHADAWGSGIPALGSKLDRPK